jgi:hypothetical protein
VVQRGQIVLDVVAREGGSGGSNGDASAMLGNGVIVDNNFGGKNTIEYLGGGWQPAARMPGCGSRISLGMIVTSTSSRPSWAQVADMHSTRSAVGENCGGICCMGKKKFGSPY